MADKQILEQMLEHLVNEDQQKAEELFHEYVVSKSREIYETLIEEEMKDEEDEEDEEVEEATEEDEDEEKVDEEFEDIAIEADDDMDDMGGDPTDDLESELDADMDDSDDDMEDKEPEELFQDLDAIVDELQAKFDAMKGDDEGEEEMKDSFGMEDTDLETVREYVEKVAPAKMGDNGANTKSIVAGKNDMGGTTANIAKGGTEPESANTKGGLAAPTPKEDNAGNINVPGGKAGGAFSKKEPGHGAEKKGSAESADNKQSLFRGRR
jgi:hypothetical protein